MTKVDAMHEWNVEDVSPILDKNNLGLRVQDRASRTEGPLHFVDLSGQERNVQAIQRIITISDPEGKDLEGEFPATVGIQREVLSGTGNLTEVSFTPDRFAARYEASFRGDVLENLRRQFPDLQELFINFNTVSDRKPLTEYSVVEQLQSLSIIGRMQDGSLNVIDVIPSGNPYELLTQLGGYLHKGIYQKMFEIAESNPRMMSILRDLDCFCVTMINVADEIRNRRYGNIQEWVPLDITEIRGIPAERKYR